MPDDYYAYDAQDLSYQTRQQQPIQSGYKQSQQPYYPEMHQQAAQPVQQIYMPNDDATSVGEWVLNLFLVAIPVVGLVLLFVWAFGSNTATSKRNWARANLIWLLIVLLLCVALVLITVFTGVTYTDYLRFR